MLTDRKTKTVIVECLECDEDIILKGKLELGQQVRCPNCGVDLEVIDTDPVELYWPYEDDVEYVDEDDDEDW